MFMSAKVQPPTSDPRLVCVARLHEQKGIPILLQAAAVLIGKGISFRVTLIGDGPLRTQITQQVDELGLKDVIELAGFRSNGEIVSALLQSRALVLPSFAEGLPVVLMESLALHRPVLSTYVGGITELVEAGVNGWLVPAGSVPALAAAMLEVLEADPNQLARMGAAGAAKVTEEHDSLREAAKLVDLFADGIADGTGKKPSPPCFDAELDRDSTTRPPMMTVGAAN
jgi:glycosyltransferase involved in cell wall biosynthesis